MLFKTTAFQTATGAPATPTSVASQPVTPLVTPPGGTVPSNKPVKGPKTPAAIPPAPGQGAPAPVPVIQAPAPQPVLPKPVEAPKKRDAAPADAEKKRRKPARTTGQ